MIKKIVIRDVATYDKEGVVLDDLQKVNFIFGGNGTGKTTISRLISSVNWKEEFPKCKVVWAKEELPVLAYNKDFRERNFREYIPGIFTLGENAAEAEQEMEALQAEQERMLKQAGEAKMKQEEYERQTVERKQELEEWIKKTVYAKYNRKYSKCLRERLKSNDAGKSIINAISGGGWMHMYPPTGYRTEKDIKDKYKLLYENPRLNFLREFYNLDEALDKIVEVTEDPIWMHRIMGSKDVPIAALIRELGIADWVRHGQEMLKTKGEWSKINKGHKIMCPFCQEHTISKDFKKEMEAFFDDEYEKAAARIVKLEMQNSALVQRMLRALDETVKQAKEDGIGELSLMDVESLTVNAQRLSETMWANTRQIQAKKAEPSREIEMMNVREVAEKLKRQIKKANRAIVKYNKMITNHEEERLTLYGAIWNMMIMEAVTDVKSANKEIRAKEKLQKKWQKEHEEAMEEYERLGQQIREKHEGIISMQPTVDRINHALRHFGFTGFSLQPSEERANHYQIVRKDGTLVKDTLSEGEVTFLTFLYFMQMIRARDRATGWVVVIDDPISSLDSSVMFVVSTMVRELLGEVRQGKGDVDQVFVLTHNVYFHKESSFINTRVNKRKDTHHWILYKHGDVTSVKAYGMESPIRGSYDLLWKELRDWKENIMTMDNIRLQNILRRIIENYFVVFGGYKRGSLIPENFTDDAEERSIAMSFARWYDEGSHDIMDDLYVESPQVMNEKYMLVFRNLFEKLGHLDHYKMMMHEEVLPQ